MPPGRALPRSRPSFRTRSGRSSAALMAQLPGIHRGIDALRPTNDVDIVLHVETTRGVASEAARALESIGYVFSPSIDERNNIADRFIRAESRVDLVTSATGVVGVLVADHAAPRVIEKLRGRDMVAIEGGTQALRRTINARVQISSGAPRPSACRRRSAP